GLSLHFGILCLIDIALAFFLRRRDCRRGGVLFSRCRKAKFVRSETPSAHDVVFLDFACGAFPWREKAAKLQGLAAVPSCDLAAGSEREGFCGDKRSKSLQIKSGRRSGARCCLLCCATPRPRFARSARRGCLCCRRDVLGGMRS